MNDTTDKKISTSETPVVARANAILDRIRAYDASPKQSPYQLDRPFDGAGVSTPGAKPSTCRAAIVVPEFEEQP